MKLRLMTKMILITVGVSTLMSFASTLLVTNRCMSRIEELETRVAELTVMVNEVIVENEKEEEIEEENEEEVTNPTNLVNMGEFKLTAYCSCAKCCGKYAYNRPVDENGNEIVYGSIGERLIAGTSIAVDPNVIPYGTEVIIDGHTYIAHDTGGAIDGNHIDVYFDNHQDALNFGVRRAEVFVATN